MSFLLYKYSIISKNMHFHAGQPFQLHSPCKNTSVCKFTENGPKVKPAIIFCRYGPSLLSSFDPRFDFAFQKSRSEIAIRDKLDFVSIAWVNLHKANLTFSPPSLPPFHSSSLLLSLSSALPPSPSPFPLSLPTCSTPTFVCCCFRFYGRHDDVRSPQSPGYHDNVRHRWREKETSTRDNRRQ